MRRFCCSISRASSTYAFAARSDKSLLNCNDRSATFLVDPGATFTVNAAASLNGNTNIGNSVGDTHTLQGTFTVTSGIFAIETTAITFLCKALATFQGAVVLGDSSSDAITLAGIMTPSGAGRIRRRVTEVTDANQTITPATADVYHAASGVLTAARNWDINDSGCADGDWMFVHNHNIQVVTVRNPSLATIIQIDNVSGNTQCALLMRIGGNWKAFRLS